MRQLTSSELTHINDWLREKYGYFDVLLPKYRVVWSDDQTEKRHGIFEDYYSGIFVRQVEETREVRKYPYIHERYVLERCFGVPEQNEELTTKTTYEPIWTFQGKRGEFLLPIVDACWWIIEGIHSAENKAAGVKYKDPRDDYKNADDIKRERVKKIYEALYGEITPIVDALDYGYGVALGNRDMEIKDADATGK